MKRYVYLLPLALFLGLAATLLVQLNRNAHGDDPTMLESVLMDKPLPALNLPTLNHRAEAFSGQWKGPALVNVWATWCPTCRAEHRFLNQLAAEGVRIYGISYKDDRQKARAWLAELGNPYAVSLYDASGMAGMELGVFGAPETFLIDAQGIVRYRLAGALTPEVWQTKMKARWQQAGGEAK